MLPNDMGLAQANPHARAVPIAVAVLRRPCDAIPTDEANGNQFARTLSRCGVRFRMSADLVVEQLEEGSVGVHHRDVLPAVVVVVEQHEAAAVCDRIQPRYSRDVAKTTTFEIQEQVIAFVAAERGGYSATFRE